MFDLYFTVRLLEELRRAERAGDSLERLVHLQACRHYQSLLTASEMSRGESGRTAEGPGSPSEGPEPY